MELFWKGTAAALVATVLALMLSRQEKDLALLLTMAGCTFVLMLVVSFLEPVVSFLKRLRDLGDLNSDMLVILLKAVGIGLVAEIAGLICTDGGNASLGKTVQLLGSAAILWLSVPVLQMLLDLIQRILGGL